MKGETVDDELLARVDRNVIRLDQRMDQVMDTLADMSEAWRVLAERINEIWVACCGERPPSDLAQALRQLAEAVQRTGDQVEALRRERPHP